MRLGNLGQMVKNPSEFVAKKSEDQIKPESPAVNDSPANKAEGPVSETQLKSFLLAFAELKKQEGKSFAYTLLKEIKAEEQDDKLVITLTNTRDQIQFDEIKTSLLQFVNEKANKSYSLEIKIEKVAQKILKVYTNKDKFGYLADKNPFLIEFSKELGLELE